MYVWIYWRYFYRVLSSMLDVSTRWNPCCRKFKTTGINPIRNWTTSWNISVTASVKPPERQKHDHAPPPRARTRLHKFHSVRNSIQPVPASEPRVESTNVSAPMKPEETKIPFKGLENMLTHCKNPESVRQSRWPITVTCQFIDMIPIYYLIHLQLSFFTALCGLLSLDFFSFLHEVFNARSKRTRQWAYPSW